MERGKTTVRGKAQSGSVVLPFVRLDTPTALSSADDYVLLLVGLNKPLASPRDPSMPALRPTTLGNYLSRWKIINAFLYVRHRIERDCNANHLPDPINSQCRNFILERWLKSIAFRYMET